MITKTSTLPYYAVIFSSTRNKGDNGYTEMADIMLELASKQDGFLGVESAREELGITVSYWKNLASIKKWKENEEHLIAKERGRIEWYISFKTRICKVESEFHFEKK